MSPRPTAARNHSALAVLREEGAERELASGCASATFADDRDDGEASIIARNAVASTSAWARGVRWAPNCRTALSAAIALSPTN